MSTQRQNIRNLIFDQFKLGNSATDAAKNICAVTGRSSTTARTCQRWYAKFKNGARATKDKKHPGRPSTINKRRLRRAVQANPAQTSRALAADLQTSHQTVIRHLHKMGKSPKSPTTVPHELTENQKNRRVSDCRALQHKYKRGGLNRILTCDEKWVLYDNRKAGKQWLGRNNPGVLKPKPELHQKKLMLSVWWMCDGPVYWELLPRGQTITANHYCQQLDKVQQKLMEKGVDTSQIFFHQDNARPHTSQQTLAKIEELGWTKINQPPYSPDIAPSDYHLFRSMDHFLRDRHFTENDQVRAALEDFFRSKPSKFYTDGIRSMREKWKKVIGNNGNYFV
jgi:histone-lysine N-methyltransferase SETMAR